MKKWTVIYRTTYSETGGNDGILALAAYKEYLYIGAGRFPSGNSPASANIYRRNGQNQWHDFTPPWSPVTSGYSMAMCLFQDHLYVGTDQGEVFRTQGAVWSNVTKSGLDGIMAMVEFQGSMYIATKGATIWRIATDGLWHPVVAPGGAMPAQFGDPTNNDISSLEVYSDHLYAGVGKDDSNGIQLWRTSNGGDWEKFHETLPIEFVQTPGHIHALRVYQDHLYVAPYHGNFVFRTDGSPFPAPGHWEGNTACQSPGDIFRMEECDGLLYLGYSYMWFYSSSFGKPLLCSSPNGNQWSPVQDGPIVDSSTYAVWSMLNSENRLYVGTRSFAPSGEAKLWQLSPSIDLAAIARYLAWAWVILVGGGLLITPGGTWCIRCGSLDPGYIGDTFVNALGIGSIFIGIAGLIDAAWKRRGRH